MADPKLNATLQESVLSILAHDNDQGRIVSLMVEPGLFEGDYRVIAERCIEYWHQFHQAPKAHVDDLLSDILDDEHNRKAQTFRRIILAMVNLAKEVNAPYVISKLTTFVRMQRFKAAVLKSAEQLNRQQETAVEEIEKLWEDILHSRSTNFDVGVRLVDFEKMLAAMELQKEFKTGITQLDQRYIVPYRGAVMLFLGAAGKGKSWWLVNLGRQAVLGRKKVLHITLEMSEAEVMQRYYQNLFSLSKRGTKTVHVAQFNFDDDKKFTGIDYEEVDPEFAFNSEMIRDELSIRLDHYEARFNNLIIKRFPPRTMTKTTLNAYLDQLELSEGFIPDLLIMDYIGLWQTDPKHHRIHLGRNLEDYRGVCVERNLAGATAHQISKAGAAASFASSFNVAEDWSMIGTADQVITYSVSDYEFKLGLARLFVNKARSERDRFGMLITQNYKIGQFALSSIYLPPKYFDFLENMKKRDDGKAPYEDEDDEYDDGGEQEDYEED